MIWGSIIVKPTNNTTVSAFLKAGGAILAPLTNVLINNAFASLLNTVYDANIVDYGFTLVTIERRTLPIAFR
ncbi:hypothetical protein SAMN05518855_1011101 [Paenibacillus sp. CF384]|nr:hypothetical protein SAMN05518855_1011101 [Paenibacillus sp. CF384]